MMAPLIKQKPPQYALETRLKAAILSDTHDHHAHTLAAIELMKREKVDIIFHAGDIISPFTAKAFKDAGAKNFIAVYGNNDGEKLILRTAIESFGGAIHEYCYKGEMCGKKIYMTHTQHNIEEIVASGMYDLVIYGHTHIQDIRQEEKTLVINPGETTDWITGQSHVVMLDMSDMCYQILSINPSGK